MTNTKKVLTVIIALLIFVCVLVIVIESGKKDPDSVANQPKEEPTKVDANPELYLYRVAEHDGKIAVFSQEGRTPLYILESPYVRDLPERDQELLRKGITVQSNTQLLEILEDYDN